jgi:hypothetical protein
MMTSYRLPKTPKSTPDLQRRRITVRVAPYIRAALEKSLTKKYFQTHFFLTAIL